MDGGDDIEKGLAAACDDGQDPSKDGWDLNEIEPDNNAPPLSEAELKAARIDLAVWHSPSDFRGAVEALHKRCRSRDFKKPGPKFLLGAWTLAEFVGHFPVDEV
jgi:hypothetical protein